MSSAEPTLQPRSAWSELLQKPWAAEASVAALALVVYLRSLTLDFVYDDHSMVQAPFAWSWQNFFAAFHRDLSPNHAANFFRPLTTLWQGAVAWVAGTNAALWHFSNILLFVICAVLVFRLAVKLLGSRAYALLATALFVVHPAHVEAVTWVSDAADSLLTIFLLLAALALLRALETERTEWFALSWLAATAACFVKETGVVFPLLLLALAWWRGARLTQPRLMATFAGYVVSVLGFLALRSSVLSGFSHPLSSASNAEMLLTVPAALWFYLSHLVLPYSLGLFYPLAFVHSVQSSSFLLPLLLLLIVAAAASTIAIRARFSRAALLLAVWLLVPMLPPMYLKLFPAFELVHDRYLYIATIALAVALAALLQHYEPRLRASGQQRWVAPAAALVLFAAAAVNVNYQGTWKNDTTLFTHAVELTPSNDRALVNLGVNSLIAGDRAGGIALLQRALEIQPKNAMAHFNLGNAALEAGDPIAAEQQMQQAIELEANPKWLVVLANVELNLGRFQSAAGLAKQALEVNPQQPGARFMLGVAALEMGDAATAVEQLSQEAQISPGNPNVMQALQAAQQKLTLQPR